MLQFLLRSSLPLRLALSLALLPALAARAEQVITQPDRIIGLGSLRCAIYTPDGSGIYAAGGLGDITLFNTQTSAILRTLKGPASTVNCLAITPDGKRLLSGCSDGAARLWDTASGALLMTCTPPEGGAVISVALTPDAQTIITGSSNGAIRAWKTPARSALLSTRAPGFIHTEYCSVAVSHDGRSLAGSSGDNCAKLWDLATGEMQRELIGHSAAVTCVAFSPDDRQVISTGADRAIVSWSVTDGQVVSRFSGHGDTIHSVAFSPDGKTVLTAAKDRTLRLWNPETKELTRTLYLKESASSVQFSSNGDRFMAPLPDLYQSSQWNAADASLLTPLSGYAGPIKDAALSPDGSLILTGHDNGLVRLWNFSTARLKFQIATVGLSALAFTPDGKQFVTACTLNGYRWNAETGARLDSYYHILSSPLMALSPDSKAIVFSGYHVQAPSYYYDHIFSLVGNLWLDSFSSKNTSNVTSALCFTPGGAYMVRGKKDGNIYLIKTGDWYAVRTFTGHTAAVNSLQPFPDGGRILSGGEDGLVRIWNVADGKPVLSLSTGEAVKGVAVSPDGLRFLTRHANDLLLWNAASGALLARYKHGAALSAAGFTPNGRPFSAGADGVVRLWFLPSIGAAGSAWSRYQ